MEISYRRKPGAEEKLGDYGVIIFHLRNLLSLGVSMCNEKNHRL